MLRNGAHVSRHTMQDTPRPATPPTQLHDLPTVASRLSISLRSLESLISEGAIPIVRVRGRLRRISESAIEEFVRRRTKHVG